MPHFPVRAVLIATIIGALTVATERGSDVSETRVNGNTSDENQLADKPGFRVGRSIFLDGDPRAALQLVADPSDDTLAPGSPSEDIVDSFIAALQQFEQDHAAFLIGAPAQADRALAEQYLIEHADAVTAWGDLYLAHRDFIMSEAIDADELRSEPIPQGDGQ